MKQLQHKKKINQNYTNISRQSSIEKFSKTSRVALSTERSEALDRYFSNTRGSQTTLHTVVEQQRMQPKMTYRPNIKRLDNCSPDRVESISKSLSKLQKLRNMHHTSNESKQYKKFQNPKTNFHEKVHMGGPGKKTESTLNNLIKRSLMPLDGVKMKNVFSNSTTPNNLKTSAKIYLETKALFNVVKHNGGLTSYN